MMGEKGRAGRAVLTSIVGPLRARRRFAAGGGGEEGGEREKVLDLAGKPPRAAGCESGRHRPPSVYSCRSGEGEGEEKEERGGGIGVVRVRSLAVLPPCTFRFGEVRDGGEKGGGKAFHKQMGRKPLWRRL